MSVNKCFGWPSKSGDLVPFHGDCSLSEGNQLSNKTNIKESGNYARSWYRALNSASFPITLGRRNVCRSLTSDTGIAWIHFRPTFELRFSFIYAVCLLEELTSFVSFCFKTDSLPHCQTCPELYLGCDLGDEVFLSSSLVKRSA